MRVIDNAIAQEIKTMWESGISSKQIQARFGLQPATLSQHARRNGLKRPHGVSSRTGLVLSGDKFICSKCDNPKYPTEFQINQCGNYMGYCRDCRSAYELSCKQSNVDRWLSYKLAQYKHRSDGLFDIDADYLKWLYERQGGKCFYTDVPLNWGYNTKSKWLSLSVDKVVPSRGYIKGNVVLAQTRINSAKSDFTLDEMKTWMTEWYRRIMSCEWLEVHRNEQNHI